MSMPAPIISSRLTLDQLLAGLADAPAIAVSGISSDTRMLAAGDVFVALGGRTSHGFDYLGEALDAGISAVIYDPQDREPPAAPVPLLPVADLDAAVGEIANRFFDFPSKRMRVAGVTGTNGKTTVAYLIRQCLNALGYECGYVGTLGSGSSEISASGGMTTPACIELHRQLAEFAGSGVNHAAIEVSSHALEQRRVDGVHFDTAIFTNLSRDHLDYHGSMRAYGETKAKLFFEHDVGHRIVNIDTDFGQEIADRSVSDVVTVSTRFDRVANGRPFVFVKSVVATGGGSKVSIDSSWGKGEFLLPLPGEFNVANAITVLGALLRWDVDMAQCCALMSQLEAPPGRMQRVTVAAKARLPAVFVDYAHTPASLEASLRALRKHCSGVLWCVFGCGGDRDRGKRSLMGKIVARHADRAIVTNDNPRFEDPMKIIADILEGMNVEPLVVEDRGAAIAAAISGASADDVVLIAGKGHEDYQIIGSQRRDFSDYRVAEAHLRARLDKGNPER